VYGFVTAAPWVRQVGNKTMVYVTGRSSAPPISLRDTVWVVPTLFRIALGAHEGTVIDRGEAGASKWLLDQNGSVVATETHSDVSEEWSIKLGSAGKRRTALAGKSALDYPWIEGIAPDGNSVWIESTIDGHVQWQSLSLADGTLQGPVPDSGQFSAVVLDRLSGRIIGAAIGDDFPRYRFFEQNISKAWEAIYKAVAEMRPKLISWSDDQLRFVVLLQTPEAGLRYVLVDLSSLKVAPIGPFYRGLDIIAEVQRLNYPAGDGLPIPAYLTLPPGREARNLPLVVLPHGGPQLRDTAEFDWLSQALAAQGYAVLRPNFRGSSVSPDFVAAGYGQWGRKMQTDLSDGVRFLTGKGLIDPKRVCIVGASYGGYAALAGAAMEPTVYRCAAAIAGIADLSRMLERVKSENYARNSPEQQYWQRFLGVSGPGDAALGHLSPLTHVAAITAPVLLIHGRDDTVVPYEQSQLMAEALRRAHKSVTIVDLKKEDHWLSRSGTRLQALEALVAFLQANNPS
jgi:dienelactone hydrolase